MTAESERKVYAMHKVRRLELPFSNIGILRMTGEVIDRFKEIALFGMALFWQKAIEFFTKFIIHFLTYRVKRLFNSEFYCLAKSN